MIRNPLINKTKIHSDHLGEDIINLSDQSFVIPSTFAYDVVEVTSAYVARPDLVSYTMYDTDVYQDLICKLNGISNPFELNEGMKLIIPEPSDLDKFYYAPSLEEYDAYEEMSSTLPKAKHKSEKRKANDALIGDDRFRIDSKNRVIIY